MKAKKLLVIGLLSAMTLSGCTTVETSKGEGTEVQESLKTGETEKSQSATEEKQPEIVQESSDVDKEEKVDTEDSTEENVEDIEKVTEEEVKKFASLIGKTSKESRAIVGKPLSSKNIENTEILLVDYYKLKYLDEIVKVEVVYNDDKQQVNFVNWTLLKANDIEKTKEAFTKILTTLYGESSIERTIDKKGKKNLYWMDDKLVYDLSYFENNISLDIYEQDK